MKIQRAFERLQNLLPLKLRQQHLKRELQNLHHAILYSFVQEGRALRRGEIAASRLGVDVDAALAELARNDLVVLDATGEVLGAYPFTAEETPQRMTVNGKRVYAMCAVDALSVSPMFGLPVQIDARCRITGEPLQLRQIGAEVIESSAEELTVGIQWQTPAQCAAHSLCREMVFLKDAGAASRWQSAQTADRDLFTVAEAIEIGRRFFQPLLQPAPHD